MAPNSNLPESFYCTNPIDFSKTNDTTTLKDKSVIVTGGANGLGLGCAEGFAEAGAYVTILDINEEQGNAAANKLREKGYHVQFTHTDTTSYSSQLSAFKSALSFSPNHAIDIVLTSAGLTGSSMQAWLERSISTDADPEPPTTATIDVNLTGCFYSAHLAVYYFRKTLKEGENSSKQLIFVSSLAGYVTLANIGDYNASKFGARGLWKALRHSSRSLGLGSRFRTNLIAPTYIRTNMTKAIEAGLLQTGVGLGEVEDVVAGVVRIACDESVSGRAIAIAPREKVAGDRNFDLGDDWEGLDAGPEVLEQTKKGGAVQGLELMAFPKYSDGKAQGTDENASKEV